jgi:hypothetical protein
VGGTDVMLTWFFCLLLWPFMPCESAEEIAAEQGATCERGCIVGSDGWVYEITKSDLVWFTRMAHCEIEIVIGTDDAEATLWAVVQNFYRRHLLGRTETLGTFAQLYSGCTSPLWATGGRYYSPIITPLADANRATPYAELPAKTREFVLSYFRNEIPNRWPGWVYVWTHGWEDHADGRAIGPFYAVGDVRHSLNAYYKDPATRHWTRWQVRVVAATGVKR